MADLGNFNANEHEDMVDFDILPQGWYMVAITKDEQRDCKDGQSKGLNLEMTVLDGNFKGRKVFNWLNLWHVKQKVKAISEREFATICRAVNIINPRNSEQLQNVPFGIELKHKKSSYSGEMEAIIKAYCSEKEFTSKASTNPAPTAPATNNEPAPWS